MFNYNISKCHFASLLTYTLAMNAKLSMETKESREHIELMLKVARMYYEHNSTQSEIAKEIGFSRPTVSRLLQESRERGIVVIKIQHPLELLMELEDALIKRFRLKCARVAQVQETQDPSVVVPKYAASLLIERSTPESLITVSNGRAVSATVREVPIHDWPKCNITQMVGALSPSNPMMDSPDICRILAARLGGAVTALHVPMILSSVEVARVMRNEPQIHAALALGGGADIALEGVGAVDERFPIPVFDSYVSSRMLRVLIAQGAVATVCGHFIDAEGKPVDSELSDRTISVDLERLRHIPLVIGVAWGSEKVSAIRACLKGGYLSALVTDQSTAEMLLENS